MIEPIKVSLQYLHSLLNKFIKDGFSLYNEYKFFISIILSSYDFSLFKIKIGIFLTSLIFFKIGTNFLLFFEET